MRMKLNMFAGKFWSKTSSAGTAIHACQPDQDVAEELEGRFAMIRGAILNFRGVCAPLKVYHIDKGAPKSSTDAGRESPEPTC